MIEEMTSETTDKLIQEMDPECQNFNTITCIYYTLRRIEELIKERMVAQPVIKKS